MADNAQKTRDLIDAHLASGETYGAPEGLFRVLVEQANAQRWSLNWEVGLTHWWDLCRIGAVAIVGGGDGGYTSGRPRYIVTARGRKLFERGESSPHDGGRYLAAVERRVSTTDGIVMTYLAEAAEAWRAGLNRSSVVMLGGACERLILMLASAIPDANIVPYSEKLRKLLATGKPAGISDVFDQVRGALNAAADDKTLPGDLTDAIDRTLTPIFEHARGLRNQQGHPTGADVSSEDAEAGLLLFPGFYALVDQLLAHLRSRA